jgi:hypothetical protein
MGPSRDEAVSQVEGASDGAPKESASVSQIKAQLLSLLAEKGTSRCWRKRVPVGRLRLRRVRIVFFFMFCPGPLFIAISRNG